jgi:ADP-ribose pyrophosphatase YjhB (NUDIX family)
MTFSNPVPVAVALIPFEGKLIGIRRGIEPRKGMVALPGGYINSGETFCAALSREVLEETGARISESSWKVLHVGDSIPSNRILIFGITTESPDLDLKFSSSETLEIVIIDSTTPLAFPLHEEVRDQYFRKPE